MARSAWDETLAGDIIGRLRQMPGASLPILHALQAEFGYIDDRAVAMVASALHLSRAEMHGIVTFYHDFRRQPAGRHIVKLCRAEACQAVGAEDLERHAKARLAIDYHHTTADDAVTLEAVYCLGNCACGPSIQIDGRTHGRVTPGRFDALMASLGTSR